MATVEKRKRATVYLEPQLHRALKVQAAESDRNVSELINEAIRQALIEDREDLDVFEERASEPTISFEKMLQRLDLDGKL